MTTEGSSFWQEKQYQGLAQLHLPAPSVVIDVRRGTDHDPPLIWNLGIELEDLSLEMELNQVYRWRHLTNCIDLLKLSPVPWDKPEKEKELADFDLTTRFGQPKTARGRKELIDELVKEHLDVVRTNRIAAGRDQGTSTLSDIRIDSEQVTVRIFFLVDAEDIDSLVSAATYARWLKIAYREYEEFGRSGRNKKISTFAICMNADPLVHQPNILAQYLNYDSQKHPALDTVILLNTYGDDEAYIGGDIQSYLVELILYSLLLFSLESTSDMGLEPVGDRSLSLYFENEDTSDQFLLPWPVLMIGISSLEYSARWGGRWLDYGLVTRIVEIIYETREVDLEDELGELRSEVHDKLEKWRQQVQRFVTGKLTKAMPRLHVFDELRTYLESPPFHGKGKADTLQDLTAFSKRICQYYSGHGNTLEKSMESAQLIPWQIRRDYLSVLKDDEDRAYQMKDLYQELQRLQSEAARLPALLYHHAQGIFPRSLRQLSELAEEVNKLHEIADTPPNLKEFEEWFNQQAMHELMQMQQLFKDQRWPSSKKVQQKRTESYLKLKAIAQSHIERVQEVIVAQIALQLLQESGLYNPNGKPFQFQENLRNLDKAIKGAQGRAVIQQHRAYKRLKVSLSQAQAGSSQAPLKLNTNNRRDWLPWTQVVESYEKHSKELSTAPMLDLLMWGLLRLLGGEKPLDIAEEYLSEVKFEKRHGFQLDKSGRDEMHVYSTILVAVLILFDIMSFDVASIQPLLDQYAKLRTSSGGEPSTLETNIIALQSFLREAKATRSGIGKNGQNQSFSSFSLPPGRLLELILAAWANNLYVSDPMVVSVLDRSGIITRLEEHDVTPVQALKDLQARNRLPGYRDSMAGDDLYYLLLAPGEIGKSFLKGVALSNFAHMRAVQFPDSEKLIYLHVHRLRQVWPVAITTRP